MNLAPAFTGTGCLKTTGRDLLSFGCSEAAAGAMNPWNDSVDSISLRGSTVRAGSEARKAPGGFTPRTVNTDFRWKLGVLKAGEETPRGGKPPVWRNHKPAGSDANSMGEGSGQPREGPPSQWRIPSTPKLQFDDSASSGAVGGDGSRIYKENFPGKAGKAYTPRGMRPRTAAPTVRARRTAQDEDGFDGDENSLVQGGGVGAGGGGGGGGGGGSGGAGDVGGARQRIGGNGGGGRPSSGGRAFVQKLPGGGYSGSGGQPHRPVSAPNSRGVQEQRATRPLTARNHRHHDPSSLPYAVPEEDGGGQYEDTAITRSPDPDVVNQRITEMLGLNVPQTQQQRRPWSSSSETTPRISTVVPKLVLIPNQSSASRSGSASRASTPRRPLSARGVDLGYSSRDKRRDAMMERATKNARVALEFASSQPGDLRKPGTGPGGGSSRMSSRAMAWEEARKLDLAGVIGSKDRPKYTAEGAIKAGEEIDDEVGLAPQPPVVLPVELHDLSLTAKLSRSKVSEQQVQGITARRPGYNPLLRKYEQKMPRAVALYLAQNAEDKSVVPAPPEEPKRPGTSNTPRQRREATGSGPDNRTKPGQGAATATGGQGEEIGSSRFMVSPRIEQLSIPKKRNPDRNDPRWSVAWKLDPSLKRKQDPSHCVDWIARNAASVSEANDGRGGGKMDDVGIGEKKGWSERAWDCREALVNEDAAVRERVLASMERRDQVETLETRRLRKMAEKKLESKQRGWMGLLVAYKFFTSALYIVKQHHQSLDEGSSRKKRGSLIGSTLKVSAFVRNLEHRTRERRMISGPLAKFADKKSFRFCLVALRWFFDNRKKIWGNFPPSFKKVVQRWLLRYYLRKQYRHFELQCSIMRGVFEQSRHSYKIRGYVQRYIQNVARCQRIGKAVYIRSKKRHELMATAFEDFEAMHILKDILREIHAMHVALQADHHQGGQHQAKHHHQVKQEGLRESQLNSLKQQASKLTPEQVTQYERKSTGVKTWVMLGIDKLGQEVLRVLTSNNIHMSSKGKDPLSAILTLFLDAKLPGNVRKRMYTEMYYDLTTKHERNVTNFIAERDKSRITFMREKSIRDALALWSPNLPNLYDQEKNLWRVESGDKTALRPRWDHRAVLDEHSSADWMSIGNQMRVSDAQKEGHLAPLSVKGLLKVATDSIVNAATVTITSSESTTLTGFGATFMASKTLVKNLRKKSDHATA